MPRPRAAPERPERERSVRSSQGKPDSSIARRIWSRRLRAELSISRFRRTNDGLGESVPWQCAVRTSNRDGTQ